MKPKATYCPNCHCVNAIEITEYKLKFYKDIIDDISKFKARIHDLTRTLSMIMANISDRAKTCDVNYIYSLCRTAVDREHRTSEFNSTEDLKL